MAKLRKMFTISVMAITVLSMSVVVAPEVNAAASAGDLIKTDAYSTVYYLGEDGKRYGFPNEATFFSWYEDFSGVMTVPQSELEGYRLAGMITMRPGTKLVKIQSDPRVYAVEPGGALRWIDSEETAQALYGDAWNTMIVDVPDAFIGNYTVNGVAYGNSTDSDIEATALEGDAYPAGAVVQWEGSDDVYYINEDGEAQKFADEAAMSANRYSMDDVIVATSVAMPDMGDELASADEDLIDPVKGSSTSGTQAGASSALSVALASDTPASATVISTPTVDKNAQAMVPFLKLNFSASADGAAEVTSLKLKRTGISNDTDLDGLFLYDGDTRLTDSTSLTSNYVTFNNSNGLFEIPAGGTKTITVYGDLYYDASSGKTIGLTLEGASHVTSNAATVSGSFPMNGNLMSTASVSDLGYVTFSSKDTPGAADTSITPGDSEQEVWKFTMQGSEQDLEVEKLVLTAVGSIQSDDLQDFSLYVNSEEVASVAAMNEDNEVTFDLSDSPIEISKGQSKVVSLRAKVTGGSTREFYFSIQNQHDILVKDANYNVYVEPYTGGSWSIQKPTSTYDWKVAAGSLSVSKSTESPTEDVVVDGTNVTLGIFDFRAAGENIKVKNLDVSVDTTGTIKGGLDNAKIYADDVQVGTTKDLTDANYDGTGDEVNFTFGSTFIVPKGETVKVKVIADIKTATSTSFSGDESLTVNIETNADNCQQMSSLGALTAPSSAVPANAVNVNAASLSVTKYTGYGDQTVVAGSNEVKLGSFVVVAGASEGVDVSSVTVTLSADEAATVTNMYLEDAVTGEQLGDVKVTPSTSNIFSVSVDLDASGAKVINLKGDVKSGSNVGTWQAEVDADGTGKVTGNAVAASSGTGTAVQTITVGSGSITASSGSQPASAILLAGSTDNKVASYTFSATNESYTVEKLILKMNNAFATSTANIKIKYQDEAGTTKTASGLLTYVASYPYATATFTGLDIYVPKDSDTDVDVYLDLAYLSQNGASGASTAIIFDYDTEFRAVGTSGTAKTSAGSADITGNTFYNRKTKITFAKQTLSSVSNGTVPVFRFTVVADSKGNAEIKQLGFQITTTTCDVADMRLYDVDAASYLTDTAVDADGSGYVKLIVGSSVGDNDVITVGTTAKTLEVRGAVSGYSADGDSITSQFKTDTAFVALDSSADLIGSYYNVWSDRSASSHTTVTNDWTNGYLLKDMDSTQAFNL